MADSQSQVGSIAAIAPGDKTNGLTVTLPEAFRPYWDVACPAIKLALDGVVGELGEDLVRVDAFALWLWLVLRPWPVGGRLAHPG